MSFSSAGFLVGEEGVDLGGRGREADEVEGRAADQGAAIGGGGGLECVLAEFAAKEGVDRIAGFGRCRG